MQGGDIARANLEHYSRLLRAGAEAARHQNEMLLRLFQQHSARLAGSFTAHIQACSANMIALTVALSQDRGLEQLEAYRRDVAERLILFADALRLRGDSFIEREKAGFPSVLMFDFDIVVDGRKLDRPVNYALVRVHSPSGFPPQRDDARPWVIIDPRAGQGSGIGGFKSESEVGVCLRDGHPVYFVMFFPDPEPKQTLADVCNAEAEFLRTVRELHPRSPRPIVTGNCQGGWATMILAATNPDLTGPVIIAGAPLSYWAGETGKNPFRYLGGLVGGALPAIVSADFGGGKFDGAQLVYNFEQLNPGRAYWRKHYDVFAEIDTGKTRFLDFERWWSGYYFMNEAEIRWIVENLFIGNRLTRGEAVLDDGTRIDLTRITAPIVVFASHGDNITPPQQALNWIADLYSDVREMQARGQVIVYTLHDSVGHLGIFVSSSVANKHHKEISSVVRTIEALPPGLYEMLILMDGGEQVVAFEAREIEDILKLDDGRREERSFSAVARLSEWAVKTYEVSVRPAVKALASPGFAEMTRTLHPARQELYYFSSLNPLWSALPELAARTQADRQEVTAENSFRALETAIAATIGNFFDLYRDWRDATMELVFHSLYSTPFMDQFADAGATRQEHRISAFPQIKEAIERAGHGGYAEAIVRIFTLVTRAATSLKRDRLEQSIRILTSRAPFNTMPLERRTQIIRDQTIIAEFAENEAMSTLPKLLIDDVDRIRAITLVYAVLGPRTMMDQAAIARFDEIQKVLLTYADGWYDVDFQ